MTGCWSIRLVRIDRLGDGGFLALPVRLALDDEFVGGRLQSVHRGLGEQRVGHHGQDLWGFAVATARKLTQAVTQYRSTDPGSIRTPSATPMRNGTPTTAHQSRCSGNSWT